MTHKQLPAIFSSLDISDWQDMTPEDLLRKPGWRFDLPTEQAALRALKYSLLGASQSYDEIGFRLQAATPVKGPVILQTLPGMRLDQQAEELKQIDPALAAIQTQQEKLAHRPLDLPEAEHFRFQVEGNLIHFTFIPANQQDAQVQTWPFHLATPPEALWLNAVEQDAAQLLTQGYQVDLPGVHWLPFESLAEAGRFRRMQEWSEVLVPNTQPGCYYAFLSHRWLTPTHPDPESLHARFAAWQFLSALCQALHIARWRGLNAARRFNPNFGFVVGPHGEELAEALLVNVLRHALDDADLPEAYAESESLEALTQDQGVAAASQDIGLQKLNAVLAERPWLRALLGRIYLWYDYSCMPQVPRTPEEEVLFRQGLGNLKFIQLLGRTAVLLDDVGDYMTRAWCTLESLVADATPQPVDLLVGSIRSTAGRGQAEGHFRTLLEDRPHIVWRAVLDTEVFGVQDLEACMQRLNLRLTDPRDWPFIYDGLRNLRAPLKIHIDESELVSGVFPLPVVNQGQAVLWTDQSGRQVTKDSDRKVLGSLDWNAALSVKDGWDRLSGDEASAVPPFVRFQPQPGHPAGTEAPPACHVVVVGSCEGESILFSNWVLKQRSELEATLGVELQSLSWLASDIAPVGHFHNGELHAQPVSAPLWLIVTLSMRLVHCQVTGILSGLLAELGIPVIELAIDKQHDNLRITQKPKEQAQELDRSRYFAIRIPIGGFPVFPGGLFRDHLLKYLLSQPKSQAVAQALPEPAKEPGTSQPFDPEAIPEPLLAALAAGDTPAFARFCEQNQAAILARYQDWSRLPEHVRRDPLLTDQWARALIEIAQFFEERGRPELMEIIAGRSNDNPVVRWQDGWIEAERMQQEGQYDRSNAVLTQVLAEMEAEGAVGGFIDNYRPKIYGLLGVNLYRMAALELAQRYTRLAVEECLRMGDQQGAAIYRDNLKSIETAIEAQSGDPDGGVMPARLEIARAQDLSDSLNYELSNRLLQSLLDQPELSALADYLPKIYGLLGSNYYHLGQFDQAETCTHQAVEASQQAGDPLGLSIYQENLRRITSCR